MSDLEQDAVLDEQQDTREDVVEPVTEDITANEDQAAIDFANGADDNVEQEDDATLGDEQVEDDGDVDSSSDEDSDAIDEDLLRQSAELGIESDGISSTAELQRLVNAVNKRFANLGAQPAQPNQQQPTKPQPQVPAGDDDLPEFQLPEDLDEEIAAPVKKVVEYANKRAERAEAQAQQVSQQLQKMQTESLFDRFDSFVNSLGDEFADAYGKGSRFEIDKQSAEARWELFQQADALARGYQSQGIDVPEREIYKRALALKRPDIGKAAANKRIQTKQAKRRQVTTNQPNRRAGKATAKVTKQSETTGDEAAIAFASEQLRKGGFN